MDHLPGARVAVIDGNRIGPAQPRDYEGIKVNSLWGEVAWQIGGADGYAMVADSDASGTSPGKKVLGDLLEKYAPVVVLMDETVAYLRQFEEGKSYPAGTFDSNLSFIQALTGKHLSAIGDGEILEKPERVGAGWLRGGTVRLRLRGGDRQRGSRHRLRGRPVNIQCGGSFPFIAARRKQQKNPKDQDNPSQGVSVHNWLG